MSLSTNYTYTTVASGTGDEAGVAPTAGLHLMGYSVRETAAGAATLAIEHGTANSSQIIVAITLAASTGDVQWFGPQGLPCAGGLWIERTAGTSLIVLITTVK